MAGGGTPAPIVAGSGFPRLALGLALVCSSLAVAALGWPLVTDSHRRQGPPLGWLLLGLAMLGVVAAGAVTSNRRRVLTLSFSILASGAFVTAGLAAAVLAAARGDAGVGNRLLTGSVLVVCGLVSGLLGHRARSMSG